MAEASAEACDIAPADILSFWRQVGPERWFERDDALDADVRSRFLELWRKAAAGQLSPWEATDDGALALTIVLDQFPRNMFRNQARAFATDAQALAAAQHMVGVSWDRQLSPLERMFVYLPFEHAEDLAMQERALELLDGLSGEPAVGDVVEWARKHRDVIARFGRFPHRNAILGRVSTPAEEEFLAQPGSSF